MQKEQRKEYTLDQLETGDRFYKVGDKSKTVSEVTGVIHDRHLGKVMTVYFFKNADLEKRKKDPITTACRKPQETAVVFLRNINQP